MRRFWAGCIFAMLFCNTYICIAEHYKQTEGDKVEEALAWCCAWWLWYGEKKGKT